MVVQIDGIHISELLVLVAAIGIDGEGEKHPLGLIEGATEHSITPRNMCAWCSLQRTTPCRPRSPPGLGRAKTPEMCSEVEWLFSVRIIPN
jgi:hypothetical protein